MTSWRTALHARVPPELSDSPDQYLRLLRPCRRETQFIPWLEINTRLERSRGPVLSAPLLYTLLSLTSNVIGGSTPCSLFLLSPLVKRKQSDEESIGSMPQMIRGRWAAVLRAPEPESRVRSPSRVWTCNQISFHLRLSHKQWLCALPQPSHVERLSYTRSMKLSCSARFSSKCCSVTGQKTTGCDVLQAESKNKLVQCDF